MTCSRINSSDISVTRDQLREVQALIAGTLGVREIARTVGLDRMCVTRTKADPAGHETMLVN